MTQFVLNLRVAGRAPRRFTAPSATGLKAWFATERDHPVTGFGSRDLLAATVSIPGQSRKCWFSYNGRLWSGVDSNNCCELDPATLQGTGNYTAAGRVGFYTPYQVRT